LPGSSSCGCGASTCWTSWTAETMGHYR
jgi:hypothetical protein